MTSPLRHGRPARALARWLSGGVGTPGPTSASVDPDAAPYRGGSGPVGVLLCHGFSGSPQALRPWGRYLAAEGFRVEVPRLPGHGTSWQELNRTAWTDWYAVAEQAFLRLARDGAPVFVAGLSMGGALALRLAEQHGARVAGLVLVNPCIAVNDPRVRVLSLLRVLPSLGGIGNDIAKPGVDEGAYDRTPLRALHSQTRGWTDVRDHLHQVRQPTLVYWSRQDHVVDPSSLALIRAGVRTEELSVVPLERSYHVATLDYDAEAIFRGSADFFRRHVGDRA